MNRSAFLLLLPLLAGCNVHSKNPAAGDDNVSIHADESGNIAFNLPIAEGKLKVPANFMHEGDVDIDGVKLMPGSSLTGFNLDSRNDVFRPTWKGAFLMCWGLLPPFKQMREAKRDRQEKQLLQELRAEGKI